MENRTDLTDLKHMADMSVYDIEQNFCHVSNKQAASGAYIFPGDRHYQINQIFSYIRIQFIKLTLRLIKITC